MVDIEDDADGAPIMMEPEVVVPCNLCKVTTSKDDVIDNLSRTYKGLIGDVGSLKKKRSLTPDVLKVN